MLPFGNDPMFMLFLKYSGGKKSSFNMRSHGLSLNWLNCLFLLQ